MISIKEKTCVLLQTFYNSCKKNNLQIQKPASLTSYHDPSIRFTNSTTSVLKPYIMKNIPFPTEGVFLMQPAMGLQGVNYWKETTTFGRFSSFFYSLGIMCPMNSLSTCIKAALAFLSSMICNMSSIDFSYCTVDASILHDILHTLGEHNIREINQTALEEFRHTYGIPEVVGIDVIISSKTEYGEIEFGNFSVICKNEIPQCVEFSVDSTLLLSAILKRHAVCCLPVVDAICKIPILRSQDCFSMAFLDFVNLACMMTMDGLKPKSRGRNGNLKEICMLIQNLAERLDISPEILKQIIEETAKSELEIATTSEYTPALSNAEEISKRILDL